MNENFLKISIRAIFTSRRASLIPTQFRGPKLKGRWQYLGRFAFSSGVNLRHRNTCMSAAELIVYFIDLTALTTFHLPFRVKIVRVTPVLWQVMDNVDWHFHNAVLGKSHTVDHSLFLAETGDPVY